MGSVSHSVDLGVYNHWCGSRGTYPGVHIQGYRSSGIDRPLTSHKCQSWKGDIARGEGRGGKWGGRGGGRVIVKERLEICGKYFLVKC